MSRPGPQDHWIDTGTIKLHYVEWPGEGSPLVLIHGLSANCHYWDALAERLSPPRRIISVDLRGRGQSDKPPGGHYGLAAHVKDMEALVKAIENGPVTAIGHSMGAYIAAALAADHPGLVNRLALVDGGGILENRSGQDVRAQIQGAIARLNKVFPSFDAYLDYWRQLPFTKPWNDYFELYLAADVEHRPDGTVICRPSAVAVEEDFLNGLDMGDYLPRVQSPGLILWAPVGLLVPDQPLMPRGAMEQAAALWPKGRLETIQGANHYTIVLAPGCLDQVEAAIKDLLEE